MRSLRDTATSKSVALAATGTKPSRLTSCGDRRQRRSTSRSATGAARIPFFLLEGRLPLYRRLAPVSAGHAGRQAMDRQPLGARVLRRAPGCIWGLLSGLPHPQSFTLSAPRHLLQKQTAESCSRERLDRVGQSPAQELAGDHHGNPLAERCGKPIGLSQTSAFSRPRGGSAAPRHGPWR